jgi:hypothetical protein
MLFIKKLKINSPSRWSGKTRNWEKMDTVDFHGLKVMCNFVRPNDVGWPSGHGDNHPETYRINSSFKSDFSDESIYPNDTSSSSKSCGRHILYLELT